MVALLLEARGELADALDKDIRSQVHVLDGLQLPRHLLREQVAHDGAEGRSQDLEDVDEDVLLLLTWELADLELDPVDCARVVGARH